MKLVAKRPIFNSKALGVTVDPKDDLFRHANEIHKGARFSIGTGEVYADLDATAKENVGLLVSRGLAVLDDEANNKKDGVISKIDAEAKKEFALYEKAMEKPPSLLETIAALLKSNQELVTAMSKKAGA